MAKKMTAKMAAAFEVLASCDNEKSAYWCSYWGHGVSSGSCVDASLPGRRYVSVNARTFRALCDRGLVKVVGIKSHTETWRGWSKYSRSGRVTVTEAGAAFIAELAAAGLREVSA